MSQDVKEEAGKNCKILFHLGLAASDPVNYCNNGTSLLREIIQSFGLFKVI